MRILITSGGTKVPIDRVRHIANMSSGTFGSQIATEFLLDGHEVIFFAAKNSKTPFSVRGDMHEDPEGTRQRLHDVDSLQRVCGEHQYSQQFYTDYLSYFTGLKMLIHNQQPDIIILAAAVSDYGVVDPVDGKIRTSDEMSIELEPLPKVISEIKKWSPDCKLVGFKLLVDSTDSELIANARKSIESNRCDMVVANDLRDIKQDNHRLTIVKPDEKPRVYTKSGRKNYLARVVVEEST